MVGCFTVHLVARIVNSLLAYGCYGLKSRLLLAIDYEALTKSLINTMHTWFVLG